MEKLKNILKILLLIISISVLTTIQFQLINSNGVNVNLSGTIDSKNTQQNSIYIEGEINSNTRISGHLNGQERRTTL